MPECMNPVNRTGVATQLAMASCANPEVVTETSTVTFFGGPKLGWQKVPVEREKIICGVYRVASESVSFVLGI